jgi:nitrogen regulatory protein P-II 1
MLRIEAYVRPSSLPVFHAALVAAGAGGITVWQTKGIGLEYRESAERRVFRGAEIRDQYIDRVRIDTVVEDQSKDAVIGALRTVANEGDRGTVKIFVTPVLEAIRIPAE